MPSFGYKAVGGSVETIPADCVFLIVFIRKSIHDMLSAAWSDGMRYQILLPFGVPGISSLQARIPIRFAGLCSGPRSLHAIDSSDYLVINDDGLV